VAQESNAFWQTIEPFYPQNGCWETDNSQVNLWAPRHHLCFFLSFLQNQGGIHKNPHLPHHSLAIANLIEAVTQGVLRSVQAFLGGREVFVGEVDATIQRIDRLGDGDAEPSQMLPKMPTSAYYCRDVIDTIQNGNLKIW
jgi:hypothetical protein